jgi:hypothetical protein
MFMKYMDLTFVRLWFWDLFDKMLGPTRHIICVKALVDDCGSKEVPNWVIIVYIFGISSKAYIGWSILSFYI